MSVQPIAGVLATAPLAPTVPTPPVGSAGNGAAFADVLGGIDQLQAMQATAGDLAVQAVTGRLDDVHDYTIAATQASLAVELTAAVRNKCVEAFNEIMRMPA